MRAIMVPYVTYQNEPSKPENVLIDIPEDETARDELLHAEWNKIFDSLMLEEVVITTESAYGDLEIGNGDCFIFFTYVNVNAGWN